jgi:hypothetical protein
MLMPTLDEIQLATLRNAWRPGMTLLDAAYAIPETREEIQGYLAKVGARGVINPRLCPQSRLVENKLAIIRAVHELEARSQGYTSAPAQIAAPQPQPVAGGYDPELGY